MPSSCCIPWCNSNYDSVLKAGAESVSVFGFPKDENLKILWLKAIPRANWSPTKYSRVCAKHFVPSDIIREETFLLPDGTRKKIPTRVRLNGTAVPSIFSNSSASLSKTVPIPRKSPAKRNKEHQERTTELNQAFEQLDFCFEDLLNYSQKTKVSEVWQVKVIQGSIKEESIEIKSEPEDEPVVGITAQDVVRGEEIEEPSDDDPSAQGNLEKFKNFQKFIGRIKEESIEIKSEPEDEPVVGITAQDVAGSEEFKEAGDNESQKGQTEPEIQADEPVVGITTQDVTDDDDEFEEAEEKKTEPEIQADEPVVGITTQDVTDDDEFEETEPEIQADDQSEASGVYALHGNENVVANFKSGKSQLESKSGQLEPDWLTLYRTKNGTRLGEKDKPQVIRVPLPMVSPCEYTILESKRVQCNRCPSNRIDVHGIRKHIRQIHRDRTNLYKCPFCPFVTKYDGSVSTHIICKHKSDKEIVYFECYTCGRRYKFKTTLVRHMKSHMTKKELMSINEVHKCQECDHLFRYKSSLNLHAENCPGGNNSEKMQCYHCFYRCKDKISLKYHIRTCHTPPERLETLNCSKCAFTTKFHENLYDHKQVCHLTER